MTRKKDPDDLVMRERKEQLSSKLRRSRVEREVNEPNRTSYRAIRREDAVNDVEVAKLVEQAQRRSHERDR